MAQLGFNKKFDLWLEAAFQMEIISELPNSARFIVLTMLAALTCISKASSSHCVEREI